MVACLAAQVPEASGEGDAAAWAAFSSLVKSMHAVQGGLQYVAVVRNGVTVFNPQTTGMDGATGEAASASGGGGVKVARRVIKLGDQAVPVVVFSMPLASTNGDSNVIEAALRVEAVGEVEKPVTTAIRSMLRLALATVGVSFALCAALVLWVLRREAVRERQRREEEHLAFSGVLANGIAHDFRNPMSSLRLDVQMLGKEAGKPDMNREKVRGLCERVRSTLDRMDKVFQEFLYLSRPASDSKERISLPEVVRECLRMLAPRFEHAGVSAVAEFAQEPVEVMAFPGALRRALVNVLTNAEQFSVRGGQVSVSVRRHDAEAVLDVCDSGPGVPKADRRRIFDMFVTTRPGGTGLGLFLARTAIERCGGTIAVVDRDGPGACFRIRMPLAVSPEEGASA